MVNIETQTQNLNQKVALNNNPYCYLKSNDWIIGLSEDQEEDL